MSDNESFESQTEIEGSTDNEDIAEQSSVVQPYQFEPVADSDYEELLRRGEHAMDSSAVRSSF